MRNDSRPVVRQRTFTEEARRTQIITCAIEVLAELGYAQSSFARIAERAGISKSVISYHFAGKDELLEQVVQSVFADAARYMVPRVRAQHSARAVLSTYLRSNLEFIRDHRSDMDAVTEIFLNVRRRDGSRRFAGGSGGAESGVKPLQEILQRGQDEGAFADFDTRTMAWAIRNLVDGVTRQRAHDPDFDFDTCIDEMVALVDRATRRGAS
jgi:TetR/AcrR family transcriptional regulator, fatty acid metabolism regulator protein